MKIIAIGTSLSGKTTLVRYLRANTEVKRKGKEIDELLTELNNGEYPTDTKYKHAVLAPKVIDSILNEKDVIFFTNTDYFSASDLKRAKEKRFTIIQITIDKDEFLRRNKKRIDEEGYGDMTQYADGMLQYMSDIEKLVDRRIEGTKSTQDIAKDLSIY